MMTASTSSASSFCEQHPHKQLTVFNGRTVCWICEADKLNANITAQANEEYRKAQHEKDFHVLRRDSLLVDETLWGAGIKNYDAEPDTEEHTNKERVKKALKSYRENGTHNTFITGGTGVGKSHLAMGLLKTLNQMALDEGKPVKCLFMNTDVLLKRIRKSFSDKESTFTEQYALDLLRDVDFLVLDDLGAETGDIETNKQATDWTSSIFRQIFESRLTKPTIITSNLTREQLERMYDRKMVSRMLNNVYIIKFEEARDKRVAGIEL